MEHDPFGRTNRWKTEERKSSLKAFYLALLPYDFYNVMPPLNILNQIFQATQEDDWGQKPYYPVGINLHWEPFIITDEEYGELREDLSTTPNLEYKQPIIPSRVQTPVEWVEWQRSV